MALPGSAIATVCRSVVDFVDSRLTEGQNPVLAVLGSPAFAVPQQADNNHRVNFFFYGIEPSADVARQLPGDPWMVHVRFLVTAFAVDEDQIGAGENDLRLLGEVLRIFHESPILPEVDVEGEAVRPQIIFESMSLDQLNHLWSTQGDVKLRPSVGYLMSLVPVVPSERTVGSPLVGAVGFETRAVAAARRDPFTGTASPPPVGRHVIDTAPDDWAPWICLVDDDTCFESLSFEIGSQALAEFTPRSWVAGRVGAGNSVTLRWETWDAAAGWVAQAGDTPADPSTDTIDPSGADTAVTVALTLPFDDRPGQLLLYAIRSWVRDSDQATLEVRSNPVLVNLYSSGGG